MNRSTTIQTTGMRETKIHVVSRSTIFVNKVRTMNLMFR